MAANMGIHAVTLDGHKELQSYEQGQAAEWRKAHTYIAIPEWIPVAIISQTAKRVKVRRLDNGETTYVKHHNLYQEDK